MTGQVCPECGTDNGSTERPEGTPEARPSAGPGCGCAERAARRAAAQAETAAAEDFDPLRIRPYVSLGGDGTAADAMTADPPSGNDAATTMPLFLDREAMAGPPPAPQGSAGEPEPRYETRDATDTMDALGGVDPVQPRRRRPFAAVAVGAAVVTVVGTAAFVGGLFSGDGKGAPTASRPCRAPWCRPPPMRPPHPMRRRRRPRLRPPRPRSPRRRQHPPPHRRRRAPRPPRPPPRRARPHRRPRPPPRSPPGRRRPRRSRTRTVARCSAATTAPRWPSCNGGCRRCGCTGGATTATTRARSSTR